MLAAVRSLYAEYFVATRVAEAYGDSQRPSNGLKQGCPLGATLFGVCIDGLHQYAQDAVPDAGVQVQHLEPQTWYLLMTFLAGLHTTISTGASRCYSGILLYYPHVDLISGRPASLIPAK